MRTHSIREAVQMLVGNQDLRTPVAFFHNPNNKDKIEALWSDLAEVDRRLHSLHVHKEGYKYLFTAEPINGTLAEINDQSEKLINKLYDLIN